ncbi:Low molecular weight phosphotyrosine protein phosphatase [Luminiphilus syltensis NOR5-1B]|uniref:protein-tyrosine-phosphatase n=1 Tax=Luminiphilus syltensis NOR5-1B TaxID=565045 RepID=B8KTI3_9GAMM|nr:low molecular weight protein-tyrosine-phosphatase [Luminiphilus syltensis]EED36993.1 Low molecular weight phosphotyrosine protein phosphatase [Luminiphilus syltensis NOR5-1B]
MDTDSHDQIGVLFVCLGNICRSPTAEGVFRVLCEREGVADQLRIDSAGTAGWHVGKPPDSRTIEAASKRGIDLSSLRARQISRGDFMAFDLVLAMDSDNYDSLVALRPAGFTGELERFLSYAVSSAPVDVPDPYYGGDAGFEQVFDLIEEASEGLLAHLKAMAVVK